MVKHNATDEADVKTTIHPKFQQIIMRASDDAYACLVDSERATISVARQCVCGKSLVSLSALENPFFLEMLKEKVPAHYIGRKHPKLSISNSKKHVDYECELMKRDVKKLIKEKLEERE